MTDNDSNLTENLANEIENAVDDLFGRYELGSGGAAKETPAEEAPAEPAATAAPAPEPAKPTAPPAEPELNLSLEEEEPEPVLDLTMEEEPAASVQPAAAPQPKVQAPVRPAAPPAQGGGELIAEMEEAILTVDWEVSVNNVEKAREILGQLGKFLNLAATPAGEVAELMDKVLKCMVDDPSAAPTSGPAHLKDGLAAIKACVDSGGTPDQNSRKLLTKAMQELQESLPLVEKNGVVDLASAAEPDFHLELESAAEVAPKPTESPSDIAVPIGMERVLTDYSASLVKALKRLTPMNDLFGRTPGMEKLHRLTAKVHDNLKKLDNELSESFNTDFTRARGKAAAGGDLSSLLHEHSATLDYCVTRLVPMESLFEKNSGYEKLHERTQKIRSRLEQRMGALERAMSGDYEPALAEMMSAAAAEEAPSEATTESAQVETAAPSAGSEVFKAVRECIRILDSADDADLPETMAIFTRLKRILKSVLPADFNAASPKKPLNHELCPWPILMKTVWGGKVVTFAPEQVAYQSPKKISARKAAKTSFFQLKTLKSSPWSRISNVVSGELANEPQKVLKKMEIPVMRPPADFPGSTMKKQAMAILYHDGLGKVLFLDAPMEAMGVPEECVWQDLLDAETGLAGTITISGEEIPIYSI